MNIHLPIMPFFPLNSFLLPGEQIPLHIFESRYRQLLDEMESDGKKVVLPYRYNGNARLGSVCSLHKVVETKADGSKDVIMVCENVFEVKKMMSKAPGKLYPGGELGKKIEFSQKTKAPIDLLNAFSKFIKRKYGTRPTLESLYNYSLMDIAACLSLANETKVNVLLAESENDRQALISNHLAYLEFLFFQEEKMENGFLLN